MGDWFYAQHNQQQGPVSIETLRGMLAGGTLSPQDLVWTQGMPDWLPASEIADLQIGHAGSPTAPVPVVPIQYGGATPQAIGYQTPSQTAQYAGFWIRFLAMIIDYIALIIAFSLISIPLAVFGGISPRSGQVNTGIDCFFTMFDVLVVWLYYALFESSSYQATPGKMALGLKVTNEFGERISLARATGRYFGKWISGMILCVGYIMAAFTERKQALHDMLASTLVLRK